MGALEAGLVTVKPLGVGGVSMEALRWFEIGMVSV